jgi:hypothetical protein
MEDLIYAVAQGEKIGKCDNRSKCKVRKSHNPAHLDIKRIKTKIPSSVTISNKQIKSFAALYISALSGYAKEANQ